MTDTMTDRELLEAAAEAAGIDKPDHINGEGSWVYFEPGKPNWNPLTDDGDAFRLAVKLAAMIDQQAEGVFVCINSAGAYASEPYGDDKYAAARLAIVRAAAALTRMESKE